MRRLTIPGKQPRQRQEYQETAHRDDNHHDDNTGVAEALAAHYEPRCNVALRRPQAQDGPRVRSRAAERPSDDIAQRNKQQAGQDGTGAEYGQHIVEVDYYLQHHHENEAETGKGDRTPVGCA